MEYIRFGTSDMCISRVGLGTAPMGSTSEWAIYWGPQDDQVSIHTIQAALDAGVNWIDTAPFYGWGHAEEIVGRAIRQRRDRLYLFTKCGTLRSENGGWSENLKPNSIRRELEASLRRLDTDYIDLYQFHDPDPTTPIEESWQTMQSLIQEGKVRHGGLSNHPPELIERALAIGPVAGIQDQYNLLIRDIEKKILPLARRHNLGVLAWSPLASGFLTDDFSFDTLDAADFRYTHPFGQGKRYLSIRSLVQRLQILAAPLGKNAVELAIAWLLSQPGLTAAIVGARTPTEASHLSRLGAWKMPADVESSIQRFLRRVFAGS